MARRGVNCLGVGAVVLIAAAVSGALIWAGLPNMVDMTDLFFWSPQAQGGGAGAPGARARPEGASPPPAPGARAPPGGASPPPGARAPSGGASPPPGARAPSDGVPTPGARTRPEGTSPPPGAHARPGGASPGSTSPQGSGARLSGIPPPNVGAGKGATPQPRGKAKAAPEHHQPCRHHHRRRRRHCTTAGAAVPPPTPPEDKPTEKRANNRIMLVIGCLYSLISFCTPIITYWSTARSVAATYAFHGWFDLLASALGSFGWLLFAVSQLHGEDGQIIGTAAVVVNAFGFAFYATYIVVKLAVAGYMGTRACLGVMLVFFGAYISAIIVSVYGPIKRESREARTISAIAFVLQIVSQSLPLLTACPLLSSMIFGPQNVQRPEHINTRKLIVYARVGNFGLSLFWVAYCSMTYEHDFFQLANDVGAALSFVSMVLHLVYALRPHAVDYPQAQAPPHLHL